MTSINPLAPETMPLIALLVIRISTLMLIAPFFSARAVPTMVRAALVVCLVMLTLPAAVTHATGTVRVTPAALTAETLIGLALGFGAAIVVAAAEFAGDLIGTQSGLSGASTLDPFTQVGTPVLGQFTKLLVVTVLFTVDGHLAMVNAIWTSIGIAPPGAVLELATGTQALAALGGDVFLEGLRFAAPVTAAVLISNVALGILARATPQLNVFMVAYPVQMMIGLGALMLSLPIIMGAYLDWPGSYASLVDRLLATFVNGR